LGKPGKLEQKETKATKDGKGMKRVFWVMLMLGACASALAGWNTGGVQTPDVDKLTVRETIVVATNVFPAGTILYVGDNGTLLPTKSPTFDWIVVKGIIFVDGGTNSYITMDSATNGIWRLDGSNTIYNVELGK